MTSRYSNLMGASRHLTNDALDEILDELATGNVDRDQAVKALTAASIETDDMLYSDTFWDDLRVPLTQTKNGSNLKPDFDETNVGLLFPQNDDAEVAYFITQLPHAWKIGTDIHLHIHWQQSAATKVTWKADIKVCPLNQAVPAAFTTYSGDTGVFEYSSGDLSQLTEIAEIDMSSVSGVSCVILGKIYRDDNVTTGDVLAWEIDFHYEIDRPGSRDEYTK